MKLYSPFKKKKQPINEADYDWQFKYIDGGFCHLTKLRKPPRPMWVLCWMGGFKFHIFKMKKTLPVTEDNKGVYSTTLAFNPEFINDLRKS
jgi:hypothetical protein